MSARAPFSGRPFVNALPGINATRSPLGAVRLPAAPKASSKSGGMARLAQRIAQPSAPSSSTRSRENFLP